VNTRNQLGLSVLVAETVAGSAIARFKAIIPLQAIYHRSWVVRILLVLRIRVGTHLAEGQLCHGKGQRLIEVHVLDVAGGIEEVVSLPSPGKRGQGGRTEFEIDVLSRSEDDVVIVDALEEVGHFAITRVSSLLS